MKIIDASLWNKYLAVYYKHEGEYSAESFCDEVIIPELENGTHPFVVDFSNFDMGVSIQMVWIMGYYLFNKGYQPKDIEKRVTLKELDFKDTHEEFIKSINDAQHNQVKKTIQN